MQNECWVWMAVRHLSVSHIISWISFFMLNKPVGCRLVNHSSYHIQAQRPMSACTKWATIFWLFIRFEVSEWLESKSVLVFVRWQSSIIVAVISAALCISRFFCTITDVCAPRCMRLCVFFCVAVRRSTGMFVWLQLWAQSSVQPANMKTERPECKSLNLSSVLTHPRAVCYTTNERMC